MCQNSIIFVLISNFEKRGTVLGNMIGKSHLHFILKMFLF